MRTLGVLVVLFDGVEALDVTGPVSVFVRANAVMDHRSPGDAAYRVRTASADGAPVSAGGGITLVPDCALDEADAWHTLVVPGGEIDARRVRAAGSQVVVPWLARHAGRYQRIVSICTGAFLLAEAGLLTGRRVTTHWRKAADLARAHPDITVDADPIFIREGRISTSAGVTSGIDLALALVEEDLGRSASLAIARDLVVFLRRSGNQRQFSTQLMAQTAQRDSLRDVQQWIADHPESDLRIESLARRARLSPRHFTRAFTAETGVPPGRYVSRARLETACRLLEETHDSIEQVARASGYPTPTAMRRAFQNEFSLSPAQFRERF
ncbi:GlxA family transcriptional regulator [Streptomyces sp. NRRL B-1347]|uniref:GlxA family transcriptional regulator n=1 Tax=Streptomyces sp. NRRL B-1347 TaxID=1476877 RepID=UPI0004C7EA72|nr:GlxA family transcriptional regulator [Streptomyces sp. NRRL B-1347]